MFDIKIIFSCLLLLFLLPYVYVIIRAPLFYLVVLIETPKRLLIMCVYLLLLFFAKAGPLVFVGIGDDFPSRFSRLAQFFLLLLVFFGKRRLLHDFDLVP